MMAAERLSTSWRLAGLLDGMVVVPEALDVPVTGLGADSRTIKPGQIFIARRGATTDGARYIDDAARAGAAALLREGEPGCELRPDGVVEVRVADVAASAGMLADRFYDHPSRDLEVVGVTGTNGKTSVTHFVAKALSTADEAPCGVLGTLGHGMYGALRPSKLTTPDVISVHGQLAELRAAGARRTIMEVSSHALDQGRVAGVDFDGAVFTNLTRDHLDYHGGMLAYGDAKRALFECPTLRYAAINADDAFGAELLAAERAGVRSVAYGIDSDVEAPPAEHPSAWLRARIDDPRDAAIALSIRGSFGEGRLQSKLYGRFNAYNLLASLAVLLLMDRPLDTALRRLAEVEAPPGRMQRFGGSGGEPLVVVDYSHTPDSLARALESLREQCSGTLWCVFGAGGERDRGKRPMMGAAAAAHADAIVLTDDNPRGEDGDRIIDDIRSGIPDGARVLTERDRAAAIALALAAAGPGDTVLVAGKGHENYQEAGGRRLPFSDAAAVRAALEAQRT
jgi:UDP-N-acetylmuramoyl-L-alanyl-D-glutamate--2,6-diaminopimelate ligase